MRANEARGRDFPVHMSIGWMLCRGGGLKCKCIAEDFCSIIIFISCLRIIFIIRDAISCASGNFTWNGKLGVCEWVVVLHTKTVWNSQSLNRITKLRFGLWEKQSSVIIDIICNESIAYFLGNIKAEILVVTKTSRNICDQGEPERC